MTTPTPQVRRATVEDLPKLTTLWNLEQLPAEHLEGRFKEFQVAEVDGELLGALGLQVAGHEGLVHSEALAKFDQADALRAQLFERVRTVAANHGLVRLWTQLATPFWKTSAFDTASAEILGKLPAAFGGSRQSWMCLKLRDDPAPNESIDKELALFKEAQQEDIRRIQHQAKIAKIVAMVVVLAVFALIAGLALVYFTNQKRLPR